MLLSTLYNEDATFDMWHFWMNEKLFQKTVCLQHTQTYKLTLTHVGSQSIVLNDDGDVWCDVYKVLFC